MRAERRGHLVTRPRTVRSQVTLIATGVVALVLALSSVGLVATQQRVLTHGIDEALVQRADNIERDIALGSLGSRLPNDGDPEDTFLQVLDEDGNVVAASANAASLRAAAAPQPAAEENVVTVDDIPLSNRQFRVLARGLDGGRVTLVVAKNLDDVNESVDILTVSLVASIPVVVCLLAALVWWLTGRVLRPVEAIRREASSIQGHELHRRLPIPGSEDEVSRLATTMNEMLGRLEEATERQRRFVADASHELRGPLTRLRSSLEVSLAHPEGLDSAALVRELLADTADLQKLVDDLLFLARSESGALDAPQVAVDLDDLVLDEARRLREHGAVEVDISGVSAARTLGDPNQLARAVRNLAVNAERHARTSVRFEVHERNGWSELVVSDDGPGIAPEHREVVFERFTRLDEARSRDAGGSGLGLAIVHDIVTRHHGVVEITDGDGPGARFVVVLPRAE